MGEFHTWFYIIVVCMILWLLQFPSRFVLRKIGINPWLSILFGIPVVNLIWLWVVAFMRWPAEEAAKHQAQEDSAE